ncbi:MULTISPECIES: hypothetical protein [unclassified Pseudomonas]|jgi:hypothetical protein|uniref:hypothetical protein n=1 Tax=unclassified Pseudomonas TaxID=196821 RepID=UPI0025561466|nr:hypothetical protein [Pseudomonas sp. efr-133-TYG-103a]
MAPSARNRQNLVPQTDDRVADEFDRSARSFESQATALTRGLHTALFIQKFKKGLLRS